MYDSPSIVLIAWVCMEAGEIFVTEWCGGVMVAAIRYLIWALIMYVEEDRKIWAEGQC